MPFLFYFFFAFYIAARIRVTELQQNMGFLSTLYFSSTELKRTDTFWVKYGILFGKKMLSI